MRRVLWVLIVGSAMMLMPGSASAQGYGMAAPTRMNGAFEAPGYYGTSWGTASFGVPRTYSEFSSPWGVGYGYGYAPYGFLPGKYGVGLWRPGALMAPGYLYGAPNYQTFAVPYNANSTAWVPPIGLYAPTFGAPGYYVH